MSLALVLGGARSGKSRFAEGLVRGTGREPVYLATGQAFDREMERRIAEHQARRPAPWRTVDAPLELGAAIRREAGAGTAVLVDCLTLWVTNLLFAERDMEAEREALLATLRDLSPKSSVVLVSNEVGLSIVPDNALARRFRDEAGLLHQSVAALAHEVHLVVAGLPLRIKG
ncbi:bifunctional adenosylcobinamide kinase/adenosylcobinamide-phosphate guanylyltransferase [Aureimonas jatrophae]|uniref:Bifunctional adenosylcobalamin biosynthesis protein n=1 Tax=Aureimonas jatrophae TaxID=1166073 RepID=A0A1H0D710_9HYPH|nr:bifunctional adenosylcobinamide kinase/adenosylcobinamide-phosphate guanylyltransferase [Aureimonas jatrophae]MBB3951738.1 adenosylcobinamide kinase/adenosylcobinamide-phosphate guanylyltransferase [Aureimonas jatrophae]SDN65943.1 adenosylcobinamide kinase /adenosylcobinamide-phosphate guanylyltransferase [Aureimonas jatrophae]